MVICASCERLEGEGKSCVECEKEICRDCELECIVDPRDLICKKCFKESGLSQPHCVLHQ